MVALTIFALYVTMQLTIATVPCERLYMLSIKSLSKSIFSSISYLLRASIRRALHKAIEKNYVKIVVQAISFLPIDLNSEHNGYTPLKLAGTNNNFAMLNELLKIDAVRDNPAAISELIRWGLDRDSSFEASLEYILLAHGLWKITELRHKAATNNIKYSRKDLSADRALSYERRFIEDRLIHSLREVIKNVPLSLVLELVKIDAVLESLNNHTRYHVPAIFTGDGLKERKYPNDDNYLLYWAVSNNYEYLVVDLLKTAAVRDNAAICNNFALRIAAQYGHLPILQELLKIDAVRDNAAIADNRALRIAASHYHFHVVQELLKIQAVKDNAITPNNQYLVLDLAPFPEGCAILAANRSELGLRIAEQTLDTIATTGQGDRKLVALWLSRCADGRTVLSGLRNVITAHNTIAKAWRKYYKTLCNNNELTLGSKFVFQGNEYDTKCPISAAVMMHPPVITTSEHNNDNDGEQKVYKHAFEKQQILAWIQSTQTNPMNRLPCTVVDVQDFPELKQFIRSEGRSKARTLAKS